MIHFPRSRTPESAPRRLQKHGPIARNTTRSVVHALVALALTASSSLGAQTAISASGAIESTSGGFEFPDGTVQTTAAGDLAPVEVSGQQVCFDPSGDTTDQIPCDGTGQDGDLQAGVAFPDPRFTDNLDGTVTDHLTGLIWLKDADCAEWGGSLTFQEALTAANSLADGSCGLTDGSVAGDWRMSNIKELLSLVDFSQHDPALPSGHPFFVISTSGSYWASTSTPGTSAGAAWQLNPVHGEVSDGSKENDASDLIWPVRGEAAGTSAATGSPVQTSIAVAGVVESTVGGLRYPDGSLQTTAAGATALAPVDDTGQRRCFDASGSTTSEIACGGTGQDGETQAGVDWPAPRFLDNEDGTVTDRLTGLVWLKDGECSALGGSAGLALEAALTAANNLADGQCGLTDGSVAGDWRLPHIKELHSLTGAEEKSPALPSGHPFVGVTGNEYWSSTTSLENPRDAWAWDSFQGRGFSTGKVFTSEVWAVRGPQ